MGQNRSATARMLAGLGNVQLKAQDPAIPPQSPIDLSSLGELKVFQPPPRNPANDLQSLGELDFPSPQRKSMADELSSLGSMNVRDVVRDYPKPPGPPAGFERGVGDPNIPESIANDDPSPIQTVTNTSRWNLPSRGSSNMEPFAHMGARALSKLKGLIPQGSPEPAGPPPNSPGVPGAFANAAGEMGPPNIPEGDIDTVQNDDPNLNIRMQLGAIDPKTAPSVLQGLRNAGGMDETKSMVLNDKLRDEEAVNLSKAQGAGSTFMTGATPEHLRQLSSDLAPLDQYRAQKQDYAQKQYEANAGGFKSPQEAAGFGRALELQKVGSPADVANIQAQGNIDVQKLRETGNDSFLDRMMQMRAAGIDPGTVFRGPNGMQFSTAPVSPGLASKAEVDIENLRRQLSALENPNHIYGVPLQWPLQDTDALIRNKKAEIAAAEARAQGRPVPTPAPPATSPVTSASGMGHVEAGTRGTINGVPHVWDGHGWLPVGQ